MNQNQCVPNWDLDDVAPTIRPPFMSRSPFPEPDPDNFMQDDEMAELAWENGRLTIQRLVLPRNSNKNNLEGAWTDKPNTRASGTLESIVNQATHKLPSPLTSIGACEYNDDLVPLYNPQTVHPSSTLDALVPNTNNLDVAGSKRVGVCSTRVGSCSGVTPSVTRNSDWSVSASGSDRWRSVKRGPDDTCDQLRSMANADMASMSFGASLDNTTRTVTFEERDHDSICHNKPEREHADEKDIQKKSISSTKRIRAAAVHNQSERKRRDKINQKMKTLQKLVPNSNKTNKASMLDEIIEYVKQLKAQVEMLNTMRSSTMLMPLAIQQQQLPQMSMMGMAFGMDPLSMILASQSESITMDAYKSITMDAYNKITAMYQQLQLQHQQPGTNQESNNK